VIDIMLDNKIRLLMMSIILLLISTLSLPAQSHGLTSASAKIEVRPSRLVEISVQFDFIELLNHSSKQYPLPIVAALPEDKFNLLYLEVLKLFTMKMKISIGDKLIDVNKRFPTVQQVKSVLQSQFMNSQFSAQSNLPYTFSDRRFFQIVSFDFKLKSLEKIDDLKVLFPDELGDIYVTYSTTNSGHVNSGKVWEKG
jgi:hypothetical protein|tara:strand:+ start:2407 stop:2997 length:591 start_codon:yes stop_codon:yes gene_type:complete